MHVVRHRLYVAVSVNAVSPSGVRLFFGEHQTSVHVDIRRDTELYEIRKLRIADSCGNSVGKCVALFETGNKDFWKV